MLSNIELGDLAIHYKIPLVTICMKDELPKRVQDGNYIINLQSSKAPDGEYNPGTHWLSMKIKGKAACFFDSFGAPCPQEVTDFVKKRKGSRLAFNNWDVQDLKSENCGFFALSFLIYMDRNSQMDIYTAFNDYVNLYGDNTKRNDAALKQFYYAMGNFPKQVVRLLNEKI